MDNNKTKIAKNTVYLYARMILLMGVSIYTSRIVLEALGFVDYGIYNVVGGVVAMVGFLNSSLTSSTQRFLNVEMAAGNEKSLNLVFCQAVNIHIIIAIVSTLILESVGMWFVINKLVIPRDQLNSAIWVFQCSILSFVLSILSAPYNAAIIANEKMSLFAWLSIFDGVLRLGVAFIIGTFGNNRLKIYAILILGISLIMRVAYNGCCVKLFKECRYKLIIRWKIMKQMLSFSSWMFFGCISDILAGQGVNMLINVFFGPILNASRAIAVQVQSAISQFSTNFMMSVNPQIIKQYSSHQISDAYKLVFQSSKLSFFLMLMIVIPITFRMNGILSIWLGDVPNYASVFTQLILIEYLIRSSYTPIAQINVASGNIKLYQFSIAVLYVIVFGGSYFLFKMGLPAFSSYILSIIIAVIGLFTRLYILKNQNSFPMGEYLRKVTAPLAIVCLIVVIVAIVIDRIFPTSVIGTFGFCITNLICVIFVCWFIGLTNSERSFISTRVSSLLKRIR